jgi:protein transport protein SEC61 subunit gamma-like protein
MQLDLKAKLREYRRVLQVARKPDKEEFMTSSKICTLGIVLIGFIGFAIFAGFVIAGI